MVAGDPLVGPVGITRAGDKLLIADPKAKAVFQVELGRQGDQAGAELVTPGRTSGVRGRVRQMKLRWSR